MLAYPYSFKPLLPSLLPPKFQYKSLHFSFVHCNSVGIVPDLVCNVNWNVLYVPLWLWMKMTLLLLTCLITLSIFYLCLVLSKRPWIFLNCISVNLVYYFNSFYDVKSWKNVKGMRSVSSFLKRTWSCWYGELMKKGRSWVSLSSSKKGENVILS